MTNRSHGAEAKHKQNFPTTACLGSFELGHLQLDTIHLDLASIRKPNGARQIHHETSCFDGEYIMMLVDGGPLST